MKRDRFEFFIGGSFSLRAFLLSSGLILVVKLMNQIFKVLLEVLFDNLVVINLSLNLLNGFDLLFKHLHFGF